MKRSRVIFTVTICALCLAGTLTATETDETTEIIQQESCCFENPRFSGTCQVTPGPDETCGGILGYLNNPNSVGKAYCGNTKVRGGWTRVNCDSSASTSTGTCTQDRE